ncbi:hypothetical protein [Aliivibrio finisterrensis]|uniref:DNA-binding protein H-NS-like N-terminal domain-containing protein n=1 Tax=Aliivibrio finisterrensis TaxID=511998 RepID=A0ABY0I6X3_9GAMM|nr:hypothetical protein [Aliivibrio finisterrensis]RYU64271.1 hypothetical protein ERW53_10030 [Aliivibrio finisterrensis]RYU83883.1 hypothetical protein ERW52_11870 [Aliivibrio finisterrensis]
MKEFKKTLLNERSLISFATSMLTIEETTLIIERLSLLNQQRKADKEQKQKAQVIKEKKISSFIKQIEDEGLSLLDLQLHIGQRSRLR